MKLPTVALVGRPNVGKSTLFNKIVGKQVSMIEDLPGVTRDRIYHEAVYNKKRFYLIDTGGIDAAKLDFNTEIKMQAEIAEIFSKSHTFCRKSAIIKSKCQNTAPLEDLCKSNTPTHVPST